MPVLAETPPNVSLPVRAARPWVVFDHTIEGLFTGALRGRLSATAVLNLRRAGLDLSKKLLPAYPFETWKQCLAIVAKDLYPHLPLPEAWRLLGRATLEGMSRTVLGRAMVGVSRLLGPLRALKRLDHTLHSADTYVEARITERSRTCVEVSINEVMEQPTYYQGVLEAYLAMSQARDGRVQLLRREGRGATFRVEWAE